MQAETQAVPMTSSVPAARLTVAKVAPTRTAFLPVLLVALAFTVWLGFQAVQLVIERQQLSQAQTSLDLQMIAATKLRASLDALATSTAKLAADGNVNARGIVEELRKRGITINPAGAPKTP